MSSNNNNKAPSKAPSVEELLSRLSTLQFLRGAAEALPSAVRSPSLRLRDFLDWTQRFLIEPCGSASHLRHSAADDGSQLSSCKEVSILDETLERHLRSLEDKGHLVDLPLRSACPDAALLEVVTDTIQATHAAAKLYELWELSTKGRLNAMIKSGGGSASNGATSLTDLTTNLLANRGDEPSACLCLSHVPLGLTRGGGVALTSLLDAGTSTIAMLDLSHMCISDDLFKDTLLPTLKALECLQVLDVSGNLLSDAAIDPIVGTLTLMDKRNPQDPTWFKSLLEIRAEGNAFLTREGEAKLGTAVAQRGGKSAEGGSSSHQRVLVVEGVGMEAFITGTALSRLPSNLLSPPPQQTQHPTLIVGSSFAAVVAVSTALGISQRLVDGFFFEVASSVFGRKVQGYNHTDSLLSATRWMRSWYTGGHYYSVEGLKVCLENLFGKEVLGSPFKDLTSKTSGGHRPRVMLVCADLDSGTQHVFRSYQVEEEHSRCPLKEVGRSATVMEALLACCATPGFFAPQLLKEGAETQRLVDTMQTSLPAAVEEGLRLVRSVSDLSIRVVAPERQARRDPSLKQTVWSDWRQLSTARVSPLVVEVISHLCRGAHSRDTTTAANLTGITYLSSFLEAPGASPSSRMWLPITYKLPAEVEVRNTHARAATASILRLASVGAMRVLPVMASQMVVPNPLAVDEGDPQRLADTVVQCDGDTFAEFFQ